MRRLGRWMGLSWAAACCLLLLAMPAWAGDCSGPDDCGSIPDNGTKAACAGGILGGCALYERSRKKKDKDKDEGEGESTDDDSLFGGGSGQDTQPPKKADKDEGTGESADASSLFGGGGNAGGGAAPGQPGDPGALGE